MTEKGFFLRLITAIALSGVIMLILTWFSTSEAPVFPWECVKNENPCNSGAQITYSSFLMIFIPVALIQELIFQLPKKAKIC